MRIRRLRNWLAMFCFAVLVFSLTSFAEDIENNWHSFRGPDGNGVAENAKPPIQWSGTSDNRKWKTEIPGKSSSSPIVWGDKIFVTTAVDTKKTAGGQEVAQAQPEPEPERGRGRGRGRGGRGRGRGVPPTTVNEFWVMCLNRGDGKVVWKTKVNAEVPHEGTHSTNTYASGSPVTDGEHVFVSFGSFGIYCLDMDGNLVWKRDLGKMRTRNSFGEGGSPALHGDTLVINWDHEGQSFIEAMDAKTGKTKWKKNRDEATSWATPLIVAHNDRVQVITNGTKVRSYDLKDGSLIWECGGQTGNAIPTPMILDDMVICMTGFRSSACFAIPLDSEGDVSGSDKIVWSSREIGPYVPTGVLYKGMIYASKTSQPVVMAVDAKTGKKLIEPTRLDGVKTMYSSMVAANDHVYATGRSGKTLVIKYGPEFEIVATNDLGEPVDATPAIVDNQIFVRGANHLYCFEAN